MQIRPQRILWPTDFSALSLKAAPYVRALCEAFDAKLLVVHVAPPVMPADSAIPLMTAGDMLVRTADATGPRHEALRLLVKRRFRALHTASTVVVGQPWREICRCAQRERVDLIVIATHGRTGLRHLLMGSTAERVVRHAPCAVLTVRSFKCESFNDESKTADPNATSPSGDQRRDLHECAAMEAAESDAWCGGRGVSDE